MLWDPKGDPEIYLREIARLVYGPKLEEPVCRGLKAIADVRCGKSCRAYFNPRNGVSLDDGLKQTTEAWSGLKDFHVDESYVSPIRFHRPTETLLVELKGQVQAVATYMQFLKDKKDGKSELTEVPRADGPFETYERLQYLQQRAATTQPFR